MYEDSVPGPGHIFSWHRHGFCSGNIFHNKNKLQQNTYIVWILLNLSSFYVSAVEQNLHAAATVVSVFTFVQYIRVHMEDTNFDNLSNTVHS